MELPDTVKLLFAIILFDIIVSVSKLFVNKLPKVKFEIIVLFKYTFPVAVILLPKEESI